MDVNHKRLKHLAVQTDAAFEEYKQNPASENHAQAYEDAKSALDHYMLQIRQSMLQISKNYK
ncbi:hypothetical protein [Paraglaciecola psychrophila]|uniref:Uncharacterized protein n=1 Tax=Paraglaciecola psychrophila 170 TaxID=1129794 RepID=K7AFE7_9ALTE|nr:hypothetical protein [Paraglaciecola psychrophila]AGH47158.1 hypothetical protein C427_5059 [Paraglaciecola psychrophila 170]GAC39358.1 hypothetical protein GPSY_3747 [Paraglaciecola psychrophila 170]